MNTSAALLVLVIAMIAVIGIAVWVWSVICPRGLDRAAQPERKAQPTDLRAQKQRALLLSQRPSDPGSGPAATAAENAADTPTSGGNVISLEEHRRRAVARRGA